LAAAFGDPQVVGDKTVIPVAKVGYGFGLGFGQGPANLKRKGNRLRGAKVAEEAVLQRPSLWRYRGNS